MTRGLGRIPRISATLPQARDQAGNDMPTDRYTPAPDRIGDYVSGLHGGGFKFHNPNAAQTCGCGSSFSV